MRRPSQSESRISSHLLLPGAFQVTASFTALRTRFFAFLRRYRTSCPYFPPARAAFNWAQGTGIIPKLRIRR